MSSDIKRVTGGGFGKASRFYDPTRISSTPGPAYNLPSIFEKHVSSPIYKHTFENPKGITDSTLPHPSRDRTAWMIGVTKNDMAYYSDLATLQGPAFYHADHNVIKPMSPRVHFSKNNRFMSLTHRYISKEHNQANLCTAGPGPKYYPAKSHIDYVAPQQPVHSFGGAGMVDRSSFLTSMVKDGYLYTARPATCDNSVNVGPANYSPDAKRILSSAPRVSWTKADRFKTDKIFISKRHVRSKIGMHSPGPCYNPTIYDLATQKRKHAVVEPGKWCP